MNRLSMLTRPFPWEPEWEEYIAELQKKWQAQRLQKRKSDLIDMQIAATMLPGSTIKRGRGRPPVLLSIDVRRAIVVIQVQVAMEECGQKFSRAEIIRRFKELAKQENYRTSNLSLFRATDIAPSVARGMRKIEQLGAIMGPSSEPSGADEI